MRVEFRTWKGETIGGGDYDQDGAEAEAYRIGALAYERRTEDWLESLHSSFACREDNEQNLIVTTPVGEFRLAAKRVRKGQTSQAVVVGRGFVGHGHAASEDQVSLPVRILGRLNAPHGASGWTFQPSAIRYADGTETDFLGLEPRKIDWLD